MTNNTNPLDDHFRFVAQPLASRTTQTSNRASNLPVTFGASRQDGVLVEVILI
jgi:hypothetical protein